MLLFQVNSYYIVHVLYRVYTIGNWFLSNAQAKNGASLCAILVCVPKPLPTPRPLLYHPHHSTPRQLTGVVLYRVYKAHYNTRSLD